MKAPLSFLVATVGLTSLVACAPSTAPSHTAQGIIGGATAGALIRGTRSNSSNPVRDAARGAIIGAAAGGLIGSIADQQRALQQSINDPNVQVNNDGSNLIVVFPDSVLFATSSFVISPVAKRDLIGLAGHLQRFPNSTVRVIGHTDSTGSEAYNQVLSERRAGAVASTLFAGGVSSGRIVTLGQAARRPIASNATAQGRAMNRRVEIIIRPNQ